MKNHVKVYALHVCLGEQDAPMCEHCRARPMVDVHHVRPRGMGGSKRRDDIANLVGLCRPCHSAAEALPEVNAQLAVLAMDLEGRKKRMQQEGR